MDHHVTDVWVFFEMNETEIIEFRYNYEFALMGDVEAMRLFVEKARQNAVLDEQYNNSEG